MEILAHFQSTNYIQIDWELSRALWISIELLALALLAGLAAKLEQQIFPSVTIEVWSPVANKHSAKALMLFFKASAMKVS